jgi:hypothetical protein
MKNSVESRAERRKVLLGVGASCVGLALIFSVMVGWAAANSVTPTRNTPLFSYQSHGDGAVFSLESVHDPVFQTGEAELVRAISVTGDAAFGVVRVMATGDEFFPCIVDANGGGSHGTMSWIQASGRVFHHQNVCVFTPTPPAP